MNQLSPDELKSWRTSGMGDIARRLNEIPKDKDVVLYCEKGIRSVIVIQRLEDAGFHNLFNLAGGMKAWKTS